jgi:hypothetical protein
LLIGVPALAVAVIAAAAVFFALRLNLPGSERTAQAPVQTPIPAKLPVPSSIPQPDPAPARERSLYEIACKLKEDGSGLNCIERLTYMNSTRDTLYEIILNIYPNAFLTPDAVSSSEFRSVYGSRFSEGSLDMKRVSLNGVPSYYEYKNEKKTLLSVPLLLELRPGESAELLLEFDVTIPKANYRFGTGRHATMLGNVFPIAAVYENGWRTDGYYPIGDPFFSDVSDYKLAVQLPREYTFACTGSIVSSIESKDTVTYFVSAPGVRDAALAFSAEYTAVTQEHGGVSIRSCASSEERANFAAGSAAEAIKIFSGLLGPYPYDTLCIVQSDIGGGMEYPEFIMIGEDCYGKYSKEFGEFCIAHETAHQWWYASVGSDQIKSPWIDEALTEYMGFVYWRIKYGKESYEKMWNAYAGPSEDSPARAIDAPLSDFANLSDYADSVYARGAEMFRELNEKLGDKVFFEALKLYYRRNSNRNAAERDLVNSFSEAADEDLSDFFTKRGISLP